MKLLIYSVILFLIPISVLSNGSKFEWAEKVVPVYTGMETDGLGNIYVVGNFDDTLDADPGPNVYNLIPTNPGSDDMFIIKYDAAGNLIWAKTIGNSYALMNAIALDSSNNLLMTGSFKYTLDFNPNAGVNNLATTSTQTPFILKLDSAGTYLWASKITTATNTAGLDILTDSSGYVVTMCHSRITKHNNSNGSIVWNKTTVYTGKMSTDINGNIYLAGQFIGTQDFDNGPGVFNMTALNIFTFDGDMYLLKLDSQGDFKWAKQYNSINVCNDCFVIVYDIKVSPAQEIVLAGAFAGSIDFNPNAGTNFLSCPTTLSINTNTFLHKMDTSGNFLWAKNIHPGLTHSRGFALAIEPSGNIVSTGTMYNPDVPINISNFCADLFKTNPAGNIIWQKEIKNTAAGSGGNGGEFIGLDHALNIYTSGGFRDTTDFDPANATVFNLITPPATQARYLHKLSFCNASTFTLVTTACDSFVAGQYHIYSSGSYYLMMTDVSGCDSLVTLQLTITNLSAYASVAGTTLTADYSPANAPNISYQWIDCANGNIPIPGETGVNFNPAQNGQYAVIINSNNCSDTSGCVTVSSVGFSELITADDIQVYPNPNNGQFVIKFKDPAKHYSFKICNVFGEKIQQAELSPKKDHAVNLSDHPDGIYIIEISAGDSKRYYKILKR